MKTCKFIYWSPLSAPNEKGELYATVHLLVAYNQSTLTDFRKMADELRQTFPQATDDEIKGGKIYRSRGHYAETVIAWHAYIPKKDYPDWHQFDNELIEYYW